MWQLSLRRPSTRCRSFFPRNDVALLDLGVDTLHDVTYVNKPTYQSTLLTLSAASINFVTTLQNESPRRSNLAAISKYILSWQLQADCALHVRS